VPAHTEPLVLECSLPGDRSQGPFDLDHDLAPYHGLMKIDPAAGWRIDDYIFALTDPDGGTIIISRSTGIITQTDKPKQHSRSGTCKVFSKTDRKF
jgi:hypothetical protein